MQEWSLCFLKLFAGKRCSGLVFCPDLRSLGQGIFSKAKEDSSSVITEQLAPFPINHDDNTVKEFLRADDTDTITVQMLVFI